MAWRSGSLARSVLSSARASLSPIRSSSSSSLPRSLHAPRLQSRRLLFAVPRNLGELGCSQSLLPLHSAVASAGLTSYVPVEARAYCELSQVVLTPISGSLTFVTVCLRYLNGP